MNIIAQIMNKQNLKIKEIDQFIFEGTVNEDIIDILNSIVIDQKYIIYKYEGKTRYIVEKPLEFKIYSDHAQILIGKHRIGRFSRRKQNYTFMYENTDTKRFIEELTQFVNNHYISNIPTKYTEDNIYIILPDNFQDTDSNQNTLLGKILSTGTNSCIIS